MTNTQFDAMMAELRGIRGALESIDLALPVLERRSDGGVGVAEMPLPRTCEPEPTATGRKSGKRGRK